MTTIHHERPAMTSTAYVTHPTNIAIQPPLILTFDGDPTHYEFAGDGSVAGSVWADDVIRTRTGEPTNPMTWGVNGYPGDAVRNGTPVYVLRQRTEHPGDRGIIAAGHVVNGDVRRGVLIWESDGRTTRYVDIVLDRVLPSDAPLYFSALEVFIPDHDWKFGHRRSGSPLTDRRDAALLKALWTAHLADIDA